MHDFKSHEGQIQCIDFHPHEFLLATGMPLNSSYFLVYFNGLGAIAHEDNGICF